MAQVSSQIGRFALLRKLGEGGMGVVYVGYDEALDRKVAVKVLHRGAEAASLHILREAQALAKLSHPNVVPVYEVGEHEGRVFLAMEYIEGRTLRAYLAEEARRADDVLQVLVQAGRGLAAAHQAGLVHRDFKPDNVLVGKDGRVRVVDFGIAVPANREGPPPGADRRLPDQPIGSSPSVLVTPMTETGTILGTPGFMSPEQILGEHATPASDQFSFCVALYRAVYQRAPFEGDNFYELAKNVASGALKPPPPEVAAPEWLWSMLTRGLSTRPEDRYPKLDALLDEIEACLPKDPDLDPSITHHDRRWVLAIMCVGGVIMVGYQAFRGTSVYDTAWKLVGIACGFQVIALLTVGILWRRLRRNIQGRHVAGCLLCLPAALVSHRLVALKLGTPVLHILVVDTLLMALIFACGAILIDRRLGYVAGLGIATTAATAFYPEVAPVALTGLLFASLGISDYISERWQKTSPRALGLLSRSSRDGAARSRASPVDGR